MEIYEGYKIYLYWNINIFKPNLNGPIYDYVFLGWMHAGGNIPRKWIPKIFMQQQSDIFCLHFWVGICGHLEFQIIHCVWNSKELNIDHFPYYLKVMYF